MNAGFYKKEGDGLLYGPNGIYTPTSSLLKENKDDYTYPIDGWYWFDDEDSAYSFFNIDIRNKPIDNIESESISTGLGLIGQFTMNEDGTVTVINDNSLPTN